MKVKTRNLIELILQCIALVLVFIPGFFEKHVIVYHLEYFMDLTKYISSRGPYTYSLFGAFNNTNVVIMIISLLLFAAILCGVILYILQFIAKGNKRNWKPTLFVSSAEFILFTITSLLIGAINYSEENTTTRYNYFCSLQIIFYIMLGVLIALMAISIIGYIIANKKGIIEETPKIYKAEIVKNISNADELKKFKELLDSGIITQEEFDEKKNQLLGL